MTARRTRKTAPVADVVVDDAPVSDDVNTNDDATPARKYFSHANCTHARKGEEGKVARATCRRNIRAWLKAEEEFNSSNNDELVAV
jgi:hypothetical protein